MAKLSFSIDFNEVCKNLVWKYKHYTQLGGGYKILFPKVSEKIRKCLLSNQPMNCFDEFKEEVKPQYLKCKGELIKIRDKLKSEFKPVEKELFNTISEVTGKIVSGEFRVFIDWWGGPGGNYRWPAKKLFVSAQISRVHDVIIHELVHQIIQGEIRKNNIEYEAKEKIVDNYLNKTKIKRFLKGPFYQPFENKKIDRLFSKTTKIKEIMKSLTNK